jgi:hypothetical protein
MKYLFLAILFLSCNHSAYKPAEDALDAAREFKNACLKGDFEKARFYVKQSEKVNTTIYKLNETYISLDKEQKKEFKEASIRILSSKPISENSSQIILSNSYDKNIDTIYVVKENNLWLVNLK